MPSVRRTMPAHERRDGESGVGKKKLPAVSDQPSVLFSEQ
jgi:hypothetical protein